MLLNQFLFGYYFCFANDITKYSHLRSKCIYLHFYENICEAKIL